MGNLVVFLKLENFQHFTIEYDVSCVFIIYGLYYVKACSFYTQFVQSVYYKRKLYFVKCFFLHLLRWSLDFYLSFY